MVVQGRRRQAVAVAGFLAKMLQAFQFSNHKSHVTRHTSHVTRHTSHVTRHTSHVTRHTSHVTCIQALSINCSDRAQPASMLLYLHRSESDIVEQMKRGQRVREEGGRRGVGVGEGVGGGGGGGVVKKINAH